MIRKAAAVCMGCFVLLAAWIGSATPHHLSRAQDVPMLTTTPSNTPIRTPLALQNPSFEINTDGNKHPDGWDTTALKRRDGVRCEPTGVSLDLRGLETENLSHLSMGHCTI
jgi:hypothetical protein